MRQMSFLLAADATELAFLNDPRLPEAARAEQYRETIARYDSKPETQEGKAELRARARAEEAKRDRALKQDPSFDYAEALLQIAIVLISVAIIAELPWLSLVGGALGMVGTLLTVNGFMLLAEVPFLA